MLVLVPSALRMTVARDSSASQLKNAWLKGAAHILGNRTDECCNLLRSQPNKERFCYLCWRPAVCISLCGAEPCGKQKCDPPCRPQDSQYWWCIWCITSLQPCNGDKKDSNVFKTEHLSADERRHWGQRIRPSQRLGARYVPCMSEKNTNPRCLGYQVRSKRLSVCLSHSETHYIHKSG